jgi:hypothetical protein
MIFVADVIWPPVAGIVAPVSQRAWSDARKATMSAMSPGTPMRRSAVHRATFSAMPGGTVRLAVIPGCTELSVIPRSPNSCAAQRMKASAPAFAAEYSAAPSTG